MFNDIVLAVWSVLGVAWWVIAWRLGMRILGLISTLVLVRLLVPADFGLLALDRKSVV